MNIVVISAAFPPMPAGESEHCRQICLRLAQRGDTVHLITSALSPPPGAQGFDVQAAMRHWRWLDLPGLLRRVLRHAPQKVLIVYSGWLYSRHPMITFFPAALKRLAPQIALTTLLEIYDPIAPQTLWGRTLRKIAARLAGQQVDYCFGTVLRDSDRLVALSEKMLGKYLEHAPAMAGKSVVCPPPPLLDVMPELAAAAAHGASAPIDALVLCYFGYVYRGKGLETLFEALALLQAGGSRFRLLMIGGGDDAGTPGKPSYLSGIKALSHALGVAQHVVWTGGYASGSHAPLEHFAAAHVCVLPFEDGIEMSRSSVAIAAAAGLPLISTRPAVLESPFIDRRNVLLCAPNDPAALAAALAEFHADQQLRATLRAGAIRLAADWYGWDRCLDGLFAECAA